MGSPITEKDNDFYKRIAQDLGLRGPAAWFEGCGRVSVKNKWQVPRANVLQRRIFTYFTACYNANRPSRGIGLKPRRRGFSTALTACHYWYLRKHSCPAALLGHQDNASTDALWTMLQGFHQHDRMDWGNEFIGSKSNIEFSNGSRVLRLTDQNPAKTRGSNMVVGHSTETAFYDNAEETLLAAQNTLDQSGGFTSFWQESTPNGAAGAFYENFRSARWPRADECPGGAEYWRKWETILPDSELPPGVSSDRMGVRIFAAWFEFDLNEEDRLSERQKRDIQATLDREEWYLGEKDLIERYLEEGPTGPRLGSECEGFDVWEQLAWRRNKIWDECKRDRFKFQQEYPADPVECFLSSGSPYFDRESLNSYGRSLLQSPRHALNGVIDVDPAPPKRATWRDVHRTEDGIFSVWERPQVGCRYLIVVDPAKGQDAVTGKDPDRHAVLVLRQAYRTADNRIVLPAVVARIKPPCLVPLYTLAGWAAELSAYYGKAVVVVENNLGQALIELLKPLNVPLWTQRVEQDPRTGRKRNEASPMVGWATTEATRPMILDYLHQVLREESVSIWCPHLIAELRTFVRNLKKGRVEAAQGSHDDDVMALAIGMYLIDSASLYEEPPRVRRFGYAGAAPGGRAAERW